jgi:glycosyltransferase involved in cell wall biosynthesis
MFVDPALLSLISQFRPDIIQVEAEPWSLVYVQMAVLRRLIAPRAKMIYFSWWNSPEWKTPLHFPGSLAYKIGRHATHLVIAGNHGAAELHRQHGYAGPIVVIPQLGVTVEEYYPCLPDPELVSRYALESSFVIGFIGRLTWRKGIETLLEAVAGPINGSWKLLLVGDGPQRDELIGRAVALGISERVVITGVIPRQQIPNYIRIMNLLVLPSSKEQWEQFGHVLVEAMACGVPVVGSSSGEIPYVIGNEELVFPTGNSVSLRKKITRVMKEPGFAAECRLQGIRRVQDNYSDEAIARQLYTVYQRLGSISNLAPAKVDPVKCL